jgi:hypothetical protein
MVIPQRMEIVTKKLDCVWFGILLLITCCQSKQQPPIEKSTLPAMQNDSANFNNDIAFLKKYTPIIILQNNSGKGKVAVSAALQGRVMTSTSDGDTGLSYGWINRPAFLSGDTSQHFNVFGGEDRIWLGPEGGQFSIYFSKGKEFNLDNWYVPKIIDIEPYDVISYDQHEAVFGKKGELTNYSGTVFQFEIKRKVKLIEETEARRQLGIDSTSGISMVAYETINELKNIGKSSWEKQTGLLSIWILGMFNPSPRTTVVVPYNGSKKELRDVVNDNYFGRVPDDRLKLSGNTIFFKADGQHRSKIGLLPENAPDVIGSYDADHGVLTVVKYTKPANVNDYVNSLWELQKEPYRGDAVNAYNDGPPSPGAKPLGPFYELESSSPAASLSPNRSITHIHSTYHFRGTAKQLDPIIQQLFHTTTSEISSAF